MKKISDFEKKYPLFVPYVNDEATRENMLTNEDLLRKYNEHIEEIQNFVQDIASRFDVETIFVLLQGTVFKLPDEILLSFIKAYLNSNEASKNNRDVLKFYNNTLHLGVDCVHYIEEHGIITNRTWRDIPIYVVDDDYNKYKKGDEIFKKERLEDVYNSLNLKEKRFVVSLLKFGEFGLLNNLFASVEITFRQLLAMLLAKGIDRNILKQEVANGLGEYNLLLLLFAIFGIDYSTVLIDNISYFIRKQRFQLLINLIDTKNVISLCDYSQDMIELMSDQQFMDDVIKKGYNLRKKDE